MECTEPAITLKSSMTGQAKRELPSYVSGRRDAPVKSLLVIPMPVSQSITSDPANMEELMSIFQESVDNHLDDPDFQAEVKVRGEEEMKVLEKMEDKVQEDSK